MSKFDWDNHVAIKCDIERTQAQDLVKCSAKINDHKNLLEVGCEFQFQGFKAILVKAKYNSENENVWYEFENNKGGIL